MISRLLIPTLLLPVLAGCAGSMSGLAGSDKLSCPVSQGVTCRPMTEVYEDYGKPARAADSALSQGEEVPPDGRVVNASTTLPSRGAVRAPLGAESGSMPLRTRPNVMRVWIAPWEDADGDLHEGAWIAMRMDDGGWNIDHVRADIRDNYSATMVPPPVRSETKPASQSRSTSAAVAADVAEVLPKGLLPGSASSAAPAEAFFDQ